MKKKCLFVFLIISCFVFGQKTESNQIIEPLLLSEIDSIYSIKENMTFFLDKNRNLSFDDIQRKEFNLSKNYVFDAQAIHWQKFLLIPIKEAKYFYFFSPLTDLSEVFVPYKNGYKKFEIGTIAKDQHVRFDILETSNLLLLKDSIDFSQPFYTNKKLVADWGYLNLQSFDYVALTNSPDFVDCFVRDMSIDMSFSMHAILIFGSFVLFFIYFFVSKDRNYLNYSFYLFFTAAMFSVRFPIVFNFLNAIEPKLFYYSRVLCVMAASGLYFYFVVSFLDFKNNFIKVYKIATIALRAIAVFSIIYILSLIINPYLPYRFLLMNIFKLLFTLLSISIFFYLLFQKSNVIFKAVLVGSLLLIVGNILTILNGSSFFFLNTVLIEIAVFTGIMSYNNKINAKKRYQNKLLLEQVRIEKQSLVELDQFKSNFFANVSHEFRTPLTLISIPIDDVLEDHSITEIKRRQFKIAKQNSERLLSLINQVLDLSKIDAGYLKLHLREDNLLFFVSTLCESFSYSAKQKNINFEISITNEQKNVWFDKDALEKIIINLLSNAIKYTPENGNIICESYLENNSLVLEVKNTGNGLSNYELKNIFQRFYQTNENNQGTGIGLALVKELVELHKGTIEVNSKPNDWTAFKVVINIDKNNFNDEEITVETTAVDDYNEADILQNEGTINDAELKDNNLPILLIVEDNADLRDLLKQMFVGKYDILAASNGVIGVNLALENIPDIIISDIMMPDKDGIALTNELKNDERTSHIPIILLTAKTEIESQFEGIEIGADDYITKPFDKRLLLLKVEKLIESRRKLQLHYSQNFNFKSKDILISGTDEKFLEKVQKVLDKDLVESSFTIEDFSRAVDMSRMQLHRKIKALTGLTASEFIRSQRLKLAAQLLKNREVNVSEIGYAVGFNNPSYFTKCFKEAYNCTPSEYAKKH